MTANPSEADQSGAGEGSTTSTARTILMSGARLATAAVLVGLLAAAIYGIVKVRNSALSERREWPSIAAPSLDGANLSLATMWRAGRLNYILDVTPYTLPICEARVSGEATFTIVFVDEGGFSVASSTLDLSPMTVVVDAGRGGRALRQESSLNLTAGDYRRIAGWRITWVFPRPPVSVFGDGTVLRRAACFGRS